MLTKLFNLAVKVILFLAFLGYALQVGSYIIDPSPENIYPKYSIVDPADGGY